MPLHDVGYRGWDGVRRGPGHAIGVIATTGIRLAWTSRWLRRALLFAWSPALFFAASFFAFEQAVEEGRLTSMREGARLGRNLDGVGMLGTVLADTLGHSSGADAPATEAEEIVRTRRLVWSRLLLAFVRAPQAVLLAVVVGLVAPTLISRDLRAKAWLVYFTRPVGRLEYILGKGLVLAAIIGGITLLPAVSLWLMGVLVSPSVTVALATWDLPLKVIASSIVLMVPTALLALAYSSLTAESRIASFAWFATWAACWIAHSSLATADLMAAVNEPGIHGDLDAADSAAAGMTAPGATTRKFRWFARAAGLDPSIDRWAWVSPYHSLGVIQGWIFGIERRPSAIIPPLVALLALCVVSVVILWRRVDAPARA
ncbi:MAG: ABC transporter permease subunit [Planctomycetia bacterium]